MTADIFKRFIRRKASLIGGIILLLFLLMALIGPFLCTQDPNAQDIANKYAPPSWEHLLGTDNLGRDTLTRMVYGARVSLLVSFVGTIIGSAIGVALGVLAGYYGGWLDSLISRFVDFLLAFPGLLLAIVVVAILGSGLENTMAAIAFYSIPYIARMVRGVVLTLKGSEYVQACKVMGGKRRPDHHDPHHPQFHVPDHRQRDPEPGHRHPDRFFPVLLRPGRDPA